jgi:hypothetical protein
MKLSLIEGRNKKEFEMGNKKTFSAEARGFIAGYIQVFLDGFIDGYQLVEGLGYWSLDREEIERSGFLDEVDAETKQDVLNAFKEEV